MCCDNMLSHFEKELKKMIISFKEASYNILGILHILPLLDLLYKGFMFSILFKDQKKNYDFLNKGAPDNLPLPPLSLIYRVTGYFNIVRFYNGGLKAFNYINKMLKKNKYDIRKFDEILDFGCGCGRVTRHFNFVNNYKITGVDVDRDLISWCKNNIDFAYFEKNDLNQCLNFNDEKFDFIYAISVFTHLDEETYGFWIKELGRILKKEGLILITLRINISDYYCLSKNEEKIFKSGNLLVRNSKYTGAFYCNTFHPKKYFKNELYKDFKIIDYIVQGAEDYSQDIVLLKKI